MTTIMMNTQASTPMAGTAIIAMALPVSFLIALIWITLKVMFSILIMFIVSGVSIMLIFLVIVIAGIPVPSISIRIMTVVSGLGFQMIVTDYANKRVVIISRTGIFLGCRVRIVTI